MQTFERPVESKGKRHVFFDAGRLHRWLRELRCVLVGNRKAVLATKRGVGVDVLTDIVCAIIPIFVFQRLQMNTRTKVALSLLMSLGVL